ncbi:MAG: phage holin family protein [Cyclobacteriaceae bacterium]|nr:phage holin family protein [Cyclobacteriaceae bacterium]
MQNGTSFLIRLLITALAILLTSYLLPGVHVENFLSALILSLLLALLNVTIKPILVIITIPVTFLTLGLFLLVINALMILLADVILPGFIVDGFWWALAFSIILWIINSLLRSLVR